MFRRSTAGAVTGVGIEVSFAATNKAEGNTPLVVVAPFPGGPADRAGIRPGDEILSIGEQDVGQLSLYSVGSLLQGPDRSEVTLKVRPHTGGPSRDVKLVRQPISFNPVETAVCHTEG